MDNTFLYLENQYHTLTRELKQKRKEFIKPMEEYINCFNDSYLLSFSVSEKKLDELLKKYYHFASLVLEHYRQTSKIVAELAQVLFQSYDLNFGELMEKIDPVIQNQNTYQQCMEDFFNTCEEELAHNSKSPSISLLYNNALKLKQKLEILMK